MAAALPAEGSPLPCTAARGDRNGTGGLVHCFVCGSGVTPGKELRLQVTYQREKVPFFPFLQNQEPAPGASGLSPDGHTLVCAVCHCFLTEQWNIFERNRTPVEKRMYWLKRPYQCDSRRVPQEWNISYDLERRVSGGGHNCESDFSSFSDNDNLSDHEMDLADRATAAKDNKCPRAAGRKNNVITVKNSPDSQRYPLAVYPAQGSPKADRAVPPRRAAVFTNNACQPAETLAMSQERSPRQRRYDGPPSDAPAQDNGLVTRSRPWPSGGNVRHAPHLFRPTGEAHPDLLRSPPAPAASNNSDICDEDEVNITSDDDFFEASCGRKSNPRTKLRPDRAPPSARKSCQSRQGTDAHACFICGAGLKLGHFQVSVQKQERARGEPFFPFLWLHSPPPGAMPITAAGTTQVCGSCHASLMQQWHSFQLADVPVLQRLYMVPLNQSSAASSPRSHGNAPRLGDERRWQRRPSSRQESCFLCGQEAGGDMKVVQAQAGAGKSRGAMYFPFLDALPCPPDAQRARNGVLCCPPCHSILEEIWAAYRLTLSQELITSVGPFLLRYHAAAGVQGAGGAGGVARECATSSASASACYLCGAELGAGAEYQLHVNPPGSCREREPFFPFLTVHPPAAGAKPADATGLVSACSLCYHDLHAQWAQHEALQPPSSPWARQYSCETFVCFFCGRERRRQGRLAAVGVARLPVFLYAPRDGRTLLVDDGRALAVGSCLECKSVVQVGGGSARSRPSAEKEAKESHKSRLEVRVKQAVGLGAFSPFFGSNYSKITTR